MPYPNTYPIVFDECRTITLSKLKKWGYMNKYCLKSGTIVWTIDDEITAQINVIVDYTESIPIMTLRYSLDGEPVEYKVYFEGKPSNLGNGITWYFLCPISLRRCRKLHLIGGKFVHRSNYDGFYSCQTESHSYRWMATFFGRQDKVCAAYAEMKSPYFKKHYKGKETRRYKRLWEIIAKYEGL